MLNFKSYNPKEKLQSILRSMLAGFGRNLGTEKKFPRILCYHGINPVSVNRWVVDTKNFDKQIAYVKDNCSVVSLKDIVEWLLFNKSLPSRAIAITFDDGFYDVYKYAYPIMQSHGVSGTVFICPGLVDIEVPVNDDIRKFMTWENIRTLCEAGWIIGSHSYSHAKLSQISKEKLRKEIVDSKKIIETHTGHECSLFCYPYGTPSAISEDVVKLVRNAGYDAGFISVTGPVVKTDDRFQLKRSKILAMDSMKTFVGAVNGKLDLWSRVEKLH